jgi:uncharacterized protein (DUF58 family)
VSLRFGNDFLTKLEYLRVVSRRAFTGQNRADRLANKRGRGIEFADHRPYTPGDDFRHIDWKVYKRLKRLLIRLFDEEQDLPIYLFLDVSRSMAQAEKFDQARRVAAALCYIGLVHFDRITILPFGGRLGQEMVPGRGRGRIFNVFQVLERLEASGETDFVGTFRQFASRPRQRGLSVVISDFLDPAGFEQGLKILASLRHDVLIVHLASVRDRNPDAIGEVQFVDAETGDSRRIEMTSGLIKAYARAWDAHAAELETFCRRYQLGYVRANAEQPFEEIILQTFRKGGFLA